MSDAKMRKYCFFFSSRRRHTRSKRDWSSDVCSSDLNPSLPPLTTRARKEGFYKLADVASLGLEYQHTVVITTRRRLAEDPEPVARFVRAWAEGLYYYRANPEASRAAVGKFMQLDDPEALAETYA